MLLVSVFLFARLQATTVEDPAVIVRRVERGIEGDSVSAMTTAWRRTLSKTPNDRLATFALATTARLTYDYDAAERLYAQVVATAPAGSDRLSTFARLGAGLAELAHSRYERADSTLVHAIADAHAANAPDADASALIALAQVRMRTVSVQSARALLDTAAKRISQAKRASTPPEPLEEQRRCVAASVHVRLATRGATDTALAGAALAKRTGQRSLQAACLFVFAQEMERQGYFDSAAFILQTRVEPLFRSAHNRTSLSAALQWGGYLSLQVGRYSRARQELLDAVSEAEVSSNGAVLAWAHLGLANIGADVGDVAMASAELQRAHSLLVAQGDRWGLATESGLEARLAVARGDPDEGRKLYLATIDSLRAIGNVFATIGHYRALAMIEQEEGHWDAADHWLQEGDRVARGREAPGWTAERRVHDATNAIGRGDLRRADSILTDALRGRSVENDNAIFFYNIVTRHAEVLARRGDLDGVERRLSEAADAFGKWRRMQGDDRQYRVALLQARKTQGYSGAGVPYAISALARGGRIAPAFKFAEERRSRDLVTRIAERDAPATDAATSRTGALRESFSVVTVDETQRALGESTALIEFVTGRGNEPVTALVLTRGGATAVTLPALDSLGGDGRRLATLVASGTDATQLAQRLGAALLGPVLSRLPTGVSRLVIVPDGVLHRIPFEVLRTADGRPLIERYAVSISPSATALVRLQRRATPPGAPTLLAFGDPAYERKVTSQGSPASPTEGLGGDFRTGFAAVGGLPRLPNSAREARNVASYFQSADVRLGSDATERALRTASLRHVSVIHFATHALVDDQVVWRSALALAPGGGYDGFVGASDLASLDLGAELVVLSGCRTAEGPVFTGEGVQGLTAPLLEAGARAVLATRWAIGDRDAGVMIDRFYAAMAAGRPAGDALRQAERDGIAAGLRASVWGAFTLVGDPTVKLALRKR
jgi:CHAT domain-containing protein/tetratricopeptide (TPR) repeat protein